MDQELEHPSLMDDVTIWCPSIRVDSYVKLQSSLPSLKITLLNLPEIKTYSKLLNFAILSTNTKYVFIVNDKARPAIDSFFKMKALLDDGYGFVGLYRLGFFGAHRDVFDRIGKFDEGYEDGGYEDNDFYLRLKEADIGCYISEEINYLQNLKSLWPQHKSKIYFHSKWKFSSLSRRVYRIRIGSDIIGEEHQKSFKKWSESSLCPIPLVTYKNDFSRILTNYTIHDSRGGLKITERVVIFLSQSKENFFERVKIFEMSKRLIIKCLTIVRKQLNL